MVFWGIFVENGAFCRKDTPTSNTQFEAQEER